MPAKKTLKRCPWPGDDPLYQQYHDHEWGIPHYDDQHLFEMLCLEGAQAGLSWITILRKRENYRKAFDQFQADKMARYGDKKVQQLLEDVGIVRNRLKVNAFILNAQMFLNFQNEPGSFSRFLWQFVQGQPIINHWKTMKSVPASTPLAEQMSRELKKRGFRFVGPTICYAFMQACGMVNDHLMDCPCHPLNQS